MTGSIGFMYILGTIVLSQNLNVRLQAASTTSLTIKLIQERNISCGNESSIIILYSRVVNCKEQKYLASQENNSNQSAPCNGNRIFNISRVVGLSAITFTLKELKPNSTYKLSAQIHPLLCKAETAKTVVTFDTLELGKNNVSM